MGASSKEAGANGGGVNWEAAASASDRGASRGLWWRGGSGGAASSWAMVTAGANARCNPTRTHGVCNSSM